MNNVINKTTLLELKGGRDSLGASIFILGQLLTYIKYKVYAKDITKLLRKEFKNSMDVAASKTHESGFDEFENLHTIDDVLHTKELLKEMYFNEELSIAMKISILDALRSYIDKNDVVFYADVIKDVLLVNDIRDILDIIRTAESAFYYIYKSKPKENQKDIFWLKEREDKSVMIMHNHIEFFYNLKLIYTLRSLTNPLINHNNLNENYIYTFPILRNTDDEHHVIINMCYEDNIPCIDLIFMLEDKIMFSLESLPLSNLSQIFVKIFAMYDDKFDESKRYVYAIEDTEINSKIENIQFRYLKRDGDYYLIFNNEKKYHFDVGETFGMFEKIFLFSTLYFFKSKNICLKELSGLSNKSFLQLLGVMSNRPQPPTHKKMTNF